MEASAIKSQFTRHIRTSMKSTNPRFNLWYCGITNNELRRKAEHKRDRGNISFWKCLRAKNMHAANEVEAYFSGKGTSNFPEARGATGTSNWVYIVKVGPPKPSGLNGLPTSNQDILRNLFFGN